MTQTSESLGKPIVGVLLAGGKSTRMGGQDKALLALAGRPMIDWAVERLRPQVGRLVINANGDPSRFRGLEAPVIADCIGGHAGPLAGVLAGLDWANANVPAARFISTVATDTPFFPMSLVARLVEATGGNADTIVLASSASGTHPVFALWPIALAETLRRELASGKRKVFDFVRAHGAVTALFGPERIGEREVDPFFNINTPEDLAEAEALLRSSP